jgi:hypothetical protein
MATQADCARPPESQPGPLQKLEPRPARRIYSPGTYLKDSFTLAR